MATGKMFDMQVTGLETMVKNVERLSAVLERVAPEAITEAAEIPMAMMRRLCPVDTGRLQKTIRFELGRGGAAATGKGAKRTQTLGGVGKTYVIGYILAGDETTVVEIRGMKRKGWDKPKKGRAKGSRKAPPGPRWQNAKLQEFGTQKMAAQPFFYPSWRATKAKMKQKIGSKIAAAFRTANTVTPESEAA